MNLMIVNPLENHATADLGKGFYNAFKSLGVNTQLFVPGELFEAKKNIFSLLEQRFGIKVDTNPIALGLEGLIDEIILHEIDTLFVIRGTLVPINHIQKLRKQLKNIKFILYSTDDPYDNNITKNIAPYYDYVISNDESGKSIYKDGHFVPVGVDDTVYCFENRERHYDLSFIGSYFKDRVDLFESNIEAIKKLTTYFGGVWIPSHDHEGKETEWGTTFGSSYDTEFFKLNRFKMNLPVEPERINVIYNASKIVPCPHRDKEWVHNQEVEANNFSPRIFECALTKAFQLVSKNRKSFIDKYFVEGEDIVYYESPADFIDKVNYFLSHEEERNKISENLYNKVLNNHTYRHRVKEILNIIN